MSTYKLQVTYHYTDSPWWITVTASSDTEARTKAYCLNPNYQILCCKEWDGEDGSFWN